MELLDAVEVLAQRLDADVRKGRHLILATLAVANPNLVGCEVDILHPQLEALEEPKARAVEQTRDEMLHAAQDGEDGPNFVGTQHDRQTARLSRTHQIGKARHLLLKHVPVEKYDRIQGLILGRRGNVRLDRQMVEERRDLGGAHRGRMPLLVKQDESPHPLDVGFFRSGTSMAEAERLAEPIEKPGRGAVRRRGMYRLGRPCPAGRPRSPAAADP